MLRPLLYYTMGEGEEGEWTVVGRCQKGNTNALREGWISDILLQKLSKSMLGGKNMEEVRKSGEGGGSFHPDEEGYGGE